MSSTAAHTGTTARRRRFSAAGSILARNEPMLWLTGGGLVICVAMIVGLLALVLYQGATTFWPVPVVQIETVAGQIHLGEVTRTETYLPADTEIEALPDAAAARARRTLAAEDGQAVRRLLRTGNFELTNEHFNWISNLEEAPAGETRPDWAIVIEREAWGRFYGLPAAFLIDGRTVTEDPAEIWARFDRHHADARRDRVAGETATAAEDASSRAANAPRYALVMNTSSGQQQTLELNEIVRAYPANRLSFGQKAGLYVGRWFEFLTADPREANSEGGVFPAIFGTVVMTLFMALAVVPFGVLAALYLREYAKAGPVVSAVRISINNLAGVPSIVFGVFGLGFFCYIVGGGLDQLFFAEHLPNPTFGTGGIFWASLTLALLTLPVVIVATEEALAAVPGSMREGSYACGASKWQTIQRIVLPRAMPGILTGVILAMARGAGEVAPLMLVGAVKLAPELPVDGTFPFIHGERSFMHLGFHIFDLGFQSQNSEAAKPIVFTTTLLLITIVSALNLAAIWLRARLHRRFVANQF